MFISVCLFVCFNLYDRRSLITNQDSQWNEYIVCLLAVITAGVNNNVNS